MRVHVKGKGAVDLTKGDYITEGGQAKIYQKGGWTFKIYHEPDKMIPEAKIQELSVLSMSNIVKPHDLVLDGKNKVVGYTMPFVDNTFVLCQLFTKAFRQRERVTEDVVLKLVCRFQETVKHVHSKKILIVDLNEMNELVSKDFKEIYLLDVDSWQTPGFRASALMESVRDRHAKTDMKNGVRVYHATAETDWFAFGVVTFQMFIGIHPYKGKHPKIADMDERMQKNISVFNKDVTIPAVCYPLDVIPPAYRDWYKAMFESGKRMPPPDDLTGAIVVVAKVVRVKGSHNFEMTELHDFDSAIVSYYYSSGMEAVVTEKSVYINNRESAFTAKNPVIGFTPKMNRPIAAYINMGTAHVHSIQDNKDIYTCPAKGVMSYQGRIYIQSNTNILEVQFIEQQNMLVATQIVANCMENATQTFEGVVLQNMIGTYFASFFPAANMHYQMPIKELSGYKIIDAKFDTGVMMVVGVKNGKYDRFIFRFGTTLTDGYDLRVVKDVAYTGLNFTVLANGLAVSMTEEEKVELFSNDKKSSSVKVVDDPDVDGSFKFFHNGTRVLAGNGSKLIGMTMKNP